MKNGKWEKGEWIAYLIKKELGRQSLVEYLEDNGIEMTDFEKFLEAGINAVYNEVKQESE